MFRPNGNSGKVRASDRLSLPYCSVDAAQARSRKRDVFALPVRNPRPAISGWKKQSDFKNLYRRRWAGSRAILVALSAFNSCNDRSPAPNSTSADRRSWKDDWCMDKRQTAQRAGWVNMRCSWAATGTTGLTPVHDARTGTTLLRTRTTTSGRAFAVMTQLYRSVNAMALQADQSKCGQPTLSSFGKYIKRFGITPSRKSKSGADFLWSKNIVI